MEDWGRRIKDESKARDISRLAPYFYLAEENLV